MRKRFITARILIPYSAILIKVVVLKDLEIKTRFLMIRLAPDYAKGQSNFVPFRTVLRYLRGDHGRSLRSSTWLETLPRSCQSDFSSLGSFEK